MMGGTVGAFSDSWPAQSQVYFTRPSLPVIGSWKGIKVNRILAGPYKKTKGIHKQRTQIGVIAWGYGPFRCTKQDKVHFNSFVRNSHVYLHKPKPGFWNIHGVRASTLSYKSETKRHKRGLFFVPLNRIDEVSVLVFSAADSTYSLNIQSMQACITNFALCAHRVH
jgi:hypothetical protein